MHFIWFAEWSFGCGNVEDAAESLWRSVCVPRNVYKILQRLQAGPREYWEECGVKSAQNIRLMNIVSSKYKKWCLKIVDWLLEMKQCSLTIIRFGCVRPRNSRSIKRISCQRRAKIEKNHVKGGQKSAMFSFFLIVVWPIPNFFQPAKLVTKNVIWVLCVVCVKLFARNRLHL